MATTRWRFILWLTDRPEIRMTKHYQHACKLCAIKRCQEWATLMSDGHGHCHDSVKWTIEKIDGHLTQWNIVFSSDDRIGPWVRRHGH